MNTTISPIITATTNPNAEVTVLSGDGITVGLRKDPEVVTFAGTAEHRVISKVVNAFSGARERLLIDAVNNRTRERNYYQLYSRLLENQISDEEFERELDTNPDEYVVPTNRIPTEMEFFEAVKLSDELKGVNSLGDLEALFSFQSEGVKKLCKKLSDGAV